MKVPWSIRLARALFVTLAVLLGGAIAAGFKQPLWTGMLGGCAVGFFFILVDSLLGRFTFRDFSFATFGLLIGLFCAWLVNRIGIFELPFFRQVDEDGTVKSIAEFSTYFIFGFFGITLALRSDRDQFSFIIPYVRFRRDASEGEPLLLDTNIVIDGRIPAVFATGFLSGNFVIARFVLDELQRLADSHDPIKGARGKRGLDCVQQLRDHSDIHTTIHEDQLHNGDPVDARLITLAHDINARLLTNDVNLGKTARARGVTVLNLNDLALALQAELAPGDELELSLVKPGKERHQAVGYLPNGAMIVVNQAASLIGSSVAITVSSTLQTSAGRMIFAELSAPPAAAAH